MHTIFTVGAKLLGVWFVYRGLILLLNTVVYGDGWGGEATVLQLVHGVVALCFALVLVFRTDWLGRITGVTSETTASFSMPEPAAALRIGIVLIGLYVFLIRLASVLHLVAAQLNGVRFDNVFGGWLMRILIECVPLALAAVFVLRADRVAGLITREHAHAS